MSEIKYLDKEGLQYLVEQLDKKYLKGQTLPEEYKDELKNAIYQKGSEGKGPDWEEAASVFFDISEKILGADVDIYNTENSSNWEVDYNKEDDYTIFALESNEESISYVLVEYDCIAPWDGSISLARNTWVKLNRSSSPYETTFEEPSDEIKNSIQYFYNEDCKRVINKFFKFEPPKPTITLEDKFNSIEENLLSAEDAKEICDKIFNNQ